VAQACSVIAMLLAAACAVGYLFALGLQELATPFSGVALHTSIALTLVAAAVLTTLLTSNQTAMLGGAGAGSQLIRRLLPPPVLVPVFVGWAGLIGQDTGWYGLEFNMAVVTIMRIVVLVGLVLWIARHVSRLEAERERSNIALKVSEEELRKLNTDLER